MHVNHLVRERGERIKKRGERNKERGRGSRSSWPKGPRPGLLRSGSMRIVPMRRSTQLEGERGGRVVCVVVGGGFEGGDGYGG